LTRILDTVSKRRRSAWLVGGLALAALFTAGTFAVPASAQPRRDDRHDARRDYHDDHRGGYYRAPPVVYGGPVYAAPPVVYGPAVGVYLPGVAIGIQ
jgi:hypothetical protein